LFRQVLSQEAPSAGAGWEVILKALQATKQGAQHVNP
jgi:hypothetical protein